MLKGEHDAKETAPKQPTLDRRDMLLASSSLLALAATGAVTAEAQTPQPKAAAAAPPSGGKPNILFIMGDDVGWFNLSAYHRGIMSGRTPNLDKLAAEGMLFTDYYAE